MKDVYKNKMLEKVDDSFYSNYQLLGL